MVSGEWSVAGESGGSGEGLLTPPFGWPRVSRWHAAGRGPWGLRAQRPGGSGDHCPNQLVQDQPFTGTGRTCGINK